MNSNILSNKNSGVQSSKADASDSRDLLTCQF